MIKTLAEDNAEEIEKIKKEMGELKLKLSIITKQIDKISELFGG